MEVGVSQEYASSRGEIILKTLHNLIISLMMICLYLIAHPSITVVDDLPVFRVIQTGTKSSYYFYSISGRSYLPTCPEVSYKKKECSRSRREQQRTSSTMPSLRFRDFSIYSMCRLKSSFPILKRQISAPKAMVLMVWG